MNMFPITLILFSVTLSAAAQILLKHGISNPEIQNAFNSNYISGVFYVLTNSFILIGFVAYILSAAAWLGVLAKVEVSRAYPFVGLGFVGTMLFAYWFLNEPLTVNKVIGTSLVVIGIYLISR